MARQPGEKFSDPRWVQGTWDFAQFKARIASSRLRLASLIPTAPAGASPNCLPSILTGPHTFLLPPGR